MGKSHCQQWRDMTEWWNSHFITFVFFLRFLPGPVTIPGISLNLEHLSSSSSPPPFMIICIGWSRDEKASSDFTLHHQFLWQLIDKWRNTNYLFLNFLPQLLLLLIRPSIRPALVRGLLIYICKHQLQSTCISNEQQEDNDLAIT